MNCHYHPELQHVVQCKGCDKPLCEQCHDEELRDYCFACALDYRNNKFDGEMGTKVDKRKYDPRVVRGVIGWYEIIGGSLGFAAILLWIIMNGGYDDGSDVVISLLSAVLFASSVLAGIMLLKGRKYGVGLSVVIQLVQITQFFIKGVYFTFLAGALLSLQVYRLFETFGFKYNAGIYSQFELAIQSSSGFMLSINFVPIAIIYFLIRAQRVDRAVGSASSMQAEERTYD